MGLVIHCNLDWRRIPGILPQTAKETGVILMIVAAASPFSWILGVERAPQLITEAIKGATSSPWMVPLLNVVLLVNLVNGQLTPPVGVLLFLSRSISGIRLAVIAKEVIPFVVVLIAALALLTYVPWLSLVLPVMFKS